MPRLLLLKIPFILFLFPLITSAQGYDVTLPEQCNATTGGVEVMNFLMTPQNANTDALLTILYQGDMRGTHVRTGSALEAIHQIIILCHQIIRFKFGQNA